MKEDVINSVEAFVPYNEREAQDKEKTLEFLKGDNCFVRENLIGHVTSGALVVSSDNMVLLNHHKKTGMWFQFGGHCDGDSDTLRSALREVYEESGLTDLTLLVDGIFNIDVQEIDDCPKKNEPEHLHYDLNYLVLTTSKEFVSSNESLELKWCTLSEAKELVSKDDIGTLRMLEKYEKLINGLKS